MIGDGREPDYYDCHWCYGVGCMECGGSGRVESRRRREEREAGVARSTINQDDSHG
jgi:hypothetical protein